MNKERIVNMKALIRRLLEKWRWILAAGLVFAIVAVGYKGLGLRHLLQNEAQQESAGDISSEGKTDGNGVETISYDEMELLNSAFDNRNTYIKESLLFRINPEAEGRASFLLQVQIPDNENLAETDQTAIQETETSTNTPESTTITEEQVNDEVAQEQTLGVSVYVPRRSTGKDGQILYVGSQNKDETQVLKSYISYIEEGIDWTELAADLSTKPHYVQELVKVEEYTGLSSARVTVIYEKTEGAQLILEQVKQSIQAYSNQLQQEQGEHILSITEEKVGTVVDPDLEDWIVNQLYAINNLYTYKTTLGRSVGSGSSSNAGSTAVPMSTIVKILVKYAIFGFVLGVFLFSGIYILFLLLSGVVLSGREFNTQYGLHRLAVFPGKIKKNPIDRLISRIDDSYLTSYDRKECFNAAVANSKARMGGRGTVAIISDLPTETVGNIVARLNTAAKGSGVYFVGADLSHSADGINKVSETDAAVILAQCGRTHYSETGVLLDTLQGTGKELLGSIVL